jgi:hypothetical protein
MVHTIYIDILGTVEYVKGACLVHPGFQMFYLVCRCIAWLNELVGHAREHMDTRVVMCGTEFHAMIIYIMMTRALNRHTALHDCAYRT